MNEKRTDAIMAGLAENASVPFTAFTESAQTQLWIGKCIFPVWKTITP